MEEQNTDKVLPKAAVVDTLQKVVDESIYELEHNLIPKLGHGEAKRLLIAVLKYPAFETDFTGDKVELIRAYSASKQLQDALVGMGVEVTVDRIIKAQMAETEASEEQRLANELAIAEEAAFRGDND